MRPLFRQLLVVASACCLACQPGQREGLDTRDAQPETPAWQAAPPMISPRAAHAVVSTADAIYALAGTGKGGDPVLDVERFDGKSWKVETRLPGEGLNAPAAAVLGNDIYLIGGFGTSTNVPTGDVLTYDTKNKTWGRAASLPAPRGGHAAVVADGRIHVLGGGNSQSTIADHTCYDPATDRWTELHPLPRAKGSVAATVLNGKIYAIGGRSGFSDFGDVDIYDPATDDWTAGPPIGPRGTSGAIVCGDAIHVFGGESQARHESLGEVLRLDPDGTWTTLAPMPTPRNFARAVMLHQRVFVVGGCPTPGMSHSSEGSAVVEAFRGK